MNAQLPITTTPKYNFPLPPENLKLPQHFMELSIRSLKRLEPCLTPFTYECTDHMSIKTTFTKLKPNSTKIPIVAIDVSSIQLGETERGILLAVRGALVWKQDHYHYLRLGPFPFHITERNKDEISCLYTHQALCAQGNLLPNIIQVQTRLTTLLERWMQTFVNQTTHDSLILWDGSLMAGSSETPVPAMEKMLKEARNRQNTILAFSKVTRLLFNGQRITDLIRKNSPPCMLKIENYPKIAGPMSFLGDVYVAKLSRGSCAFRLDMDKQLLKSHAVDAVQKLLGNDLILQSYPETLRLAHIFSTFTANEVLGLQRCVAKESNVKIVTKLNVRRLLFGCFGKGPEGT